MFQSRNDFTLLFTLQYVLSSGKDSLVKLWELSTSRCLIAYTGAGTTGKMEHRTQAVFNHTEDYGRQYSQFVMIIMIFMGPLTVKAIQSNNYP